MARSSTLKNEIKRRLKSLRLAVLQALFPFDAQRLRAALEGLDVQSGDAILVHSSFDAFGGFKGKPNEVIQVLQGCVGSSGLLMMPTMPFTGSAIELARSTPLFDVRRTPSRMGMVSELFRRSPGVVRSVHPTHPVACWGEEGAAVAQGHHLSATPCGRGTPFEALLQRRGKVLLLGTDISVLTFYHHLEEVFEKDLPASPFTKEVFTLRSKTVDGTIVETRCRLYEPTMSRRRNLYKLVPYLKKHGAWRERRVGRLRIAVLQATGVESALREMHKQGVYCYD
jgi:aminoglycoside 3-N-acetyltransferase